MAKLVTVATFTNINYASLAKLRLDMAEIDSVIMDGETVAMDYLLGPAIGLIKLQVEESDEQAAAEVLASKGESSPNEDEDEGDGERGESESGESAESGRGAESP